MYFCGIFCFAHFEPADVDYIMAAPEQIRDAAYINDRMPGIAKFIDKSRLKIGVQTITNRIGAIFSAKKFIGMEDDDKLRRQLKETFFKFSNIHN